jgi:hypothetical protein
VRLIAGSAFERKLQSPVSALLLIVESQRSDSGARI